VWGLVMVMALLSLPVAIAGRFARSLWQSMLLAALLSGALTTVGLAVSYRADLPSGAVTILLAGALYVVTVLVPRRGRRPAARPAVRSGG
jgi:zinc transport system permease protein